MSMVKSASRFYGGIASLSTFLTLLSVVLFRIFLSTISEAFYICYGKL